MDSLISIVKNSIIKYKDKIVFSDENVSISYSDFGTKISAVGSFLLKQKASIVCILLNKSVKTLNCMFGCVFAGSPYVILDANSPKDRLQKIIDSVKPSILIYDDKTEPLMNTIEKTNVNKVVNYANIEVEKINVNLLDEAEANSKPNDLVYILFTSGSTGNPKGVMINQSNVISYISWFTKCFSINSETIFGNQTPFYFSMSVSDVYATIFSGASLHIIPLSYFSFPINLVKFLNDKKINTIYWTPSVFSIISFFKIFDYLLPKYLKTVLFAGEVMQVKDLNYFMSKLPNCAYANLFGPTETTDICTYYKVNRHFSDSDSLPIGVPCEGLKCYLLNKDLSICKENEEGELYVCGPFVSPGYFNNPEKTKESFIIKTFENSHQETLYKTGDLCRINNLGEFIFSGRSDFQIKHMGYRIELGEIETALMSNDKVLSSIAIYSNQQDKIIMIYCGNIDKIKALEILKAKVPQYMVPNLLIRVDSMKRNPNGKIDRNWYKEHFKELVEKN
jgi:D-alanine--poly(phosphoribitol) ligase subunit 1